MAFGAATAVDRDLMVIGLITAAIGVIRRIAGIAYVKSATATLWSVSTETNRQSLN